MSIPTMPNVFVYPPEEDHDPPYCCFNAAHPQERDEFDVESILEQPPAPRNTARSIADILTSEDDDEEYAQDIAVRGNCTGDNSVDSEVVEVVKVGKRHEPLSNPPPTSTSESNIKRAKTLRSRASRAFHSIKNVARSRSKKPDTDVDVEYEPSYEPSSRAPSPSPSRRSSVVFSQLFSAPSALPSRASTDSFNDHASHPHTSISSPIIATAMDPLSSAEMQSFIPYPDSDIDDEDDDVQRVHTTPRATRHSADLRSPSPTPSMGTASSKLGRRRFSVLNLFSGSSPVKPPTSTPTSSVVPKARDSSSSEPPTLSSESCSSGTGSTSSSIPATPVEEECPSLPTPKPSKVPKLRGFRSFSRSKADQAKPTKEAPPSQVHVAVAVAPSVPVPVNPVSVGAGAEHDNDIDPDMTIGEMRLDSLHFSDLSFDVDRF